MTERCEACGQPTVRFGASVFPGECDGDCGCLETQLDQRCREVSVLQAQAQRDQATIAAARKCIEAADGLVAISNRKHDFCDAYHAARAEFAKVAERGGK